MRIPCQAALHFAQNRSSLSNYCNNFRVRTSRRGPFHSQFSQFSTVAPPCACELHAKPLFTSRRATLHFQIIATIFSCEPRAEGFITFNSQLSTVAPPCACELHAKPLFISRRATLHFQIIATIFACEPRAEGFSTFNSQFSILNCRIAFHMRTPRRGFFHFQFSILNFQLSHRISHANLALRAVPLSIFNFQFSIFNFRIAFQRRTSRRGLLYSAFCAFTRGSARP
jgi:hypothetical protein